MKKTNGITLVALIITVIVMLILVGVTVSVVINSNLIGTAQNAADATEAAYENEKNLSKITIGGVTYPSLEAYTTGWDAGSGVNYPKLATGMKAVYWDNAGNEITQDNSNFNWNNWFDYKAQAAGVDGTSKWANAKTEDGSYWVWIPRFEYKITTPLEGAEAGTIDVRFISTDVKQGTAGYTTTNGITVSSDNYIIHPAFTSNVDVGGFGKELAGFWVAKYKMSMEQSTDNGATWTNITLSTDSTVDDTKKGNIATTNAGNSNYIRAVSKPNVNSWRWINIANAYTNSYYYDRNKDSHLMKNSEWGAVAYLTHSQYGRNGHEIIGNLSVYISASGGVETSSTGNISGIYDLADGGLEYMAAFNSAYDGNVYYSDSSFTDASGKHFGRYNGSSTKYATKYYNDTKQIYIGEEIENNYKSFEEFEKAGKIVSITGDAIKEIHLSGNSNWFGTLNNFISSTKVIYARGAGKEGPSIFFVYGSTGYRNVDHAFRVVLAD